MMTNTPETPKTMTGSVVGFERGYYHVVTNAERNHLKDLHLIASQMKGANVGDRVVLEYQVTSRSGLWNVVQVLPKTREDQIADAVQSLLDVATESASAADETFSICRICQECDSHAAECFVPLLKKWQESA